LSFGDTTVEVNTITNNLRFPGQYYDAETGTHYNYFRDYDPSTGRYVQSDPIGLEGGLNAFGYVGGDPINIMDVFGLQGKRLDGGRKRRPPKSWQQRADQFHNWSNYVSMAATAILIIQPELALPLAGTAVLLDAAGTLIDISLTANINITGVAGTGLNASILYIGIGLSKGLPLPYRMSAAVIVDSISQSTDYVFDIAAENEERDRGYCD
jgi:RHS repeat-associated protein